MQQIIEARRSKGAFTGFADFCRKVDPSVLTKKVLESLVYAGAFDSLGYARGALIQTHEKVSVPIASLVGEEKSILGSYMGSSVPRRDLPRLFELYAAGLLPADALLTSRSVPLDDVNVALDRLHSGAEVRQILTPGG